MIRERERVFLWNVTAYDPAVIADRVGQAMDKILLKPKGRVLVRPDCMLAHPELFPHDYTRPEMLDGVLLALRERWNEDAEGLEVGARCAAGLPTRLPFGAAGYPEVCKRHGAAVRYFEEERPVEVPIEGKERLRPSLWLPEPAADATFLVSLPKLATSPITTLSGALAGNLGLQDDTARLLDHDYRLSGKLCDLAAARPPALVVIDAVSARLFGRAPADLGLLIVGTNPVATDAIACRLAGLQPADVEHVRLAHERGLGPVALTEIALRGDVSLEDACARAKAKGFVPPKETVEALVKDSRIRAVVGPAPGGHVGDVCAGGCPAVALEALEFIRRVQPDALRRSLPLLLLYGDHQGHDLDSRPNEEIVLVGDCARVSGRVGRQALVSERTWTEPTARSTPPGTAGGPVLRLLRLLWLLWRARNATHVRVPGCTTSTAEQVLLLTRLGKVRNPLADKRVLLPLLRAWLASAATLLGRRLGGKLKPRAVPPPQAEGAEVDRPHDHDGGTS